MSEFKEGVSHASPHEPFSKALTEKIRSLEGMLATQGVKVVIEKNRSAVPVGSEAFKYGFVGNVDLSRVDPKDLPQMCFIKGSLVLSKEFIEKLSVDSSFRSFEFNCPISIVGASTLAKAEKDALLRKLWEANGVDAPGPDEIKFVE